MPLDSPSLPLFEQLGWMTIHERLEFTKCIKIYKATHGMTPAYISDLFQFQSPENYNFRSASNNNMTIQRHNTKSFEKSLQYSGTQLWNSLPLSIRSAENVFKFKTLAHKFIISKRNDQ